MPAIPLFFLQLYVCLQCVRVCCMSVCCLHLRKRESEVRRPGRFLYNVKLIFEHKVRLEQNGPDVGEEAGSRS